jgi:hypothetical protein
MQGESGVAAQQERVVDQAVRGFGGLQDRWRQERTVPCG